MLIQARWITIVCDRYKFVSRMAVRGNCTDGADVKEQTSAAALDTRDVAAQPALAHDLYPSGYDVASGMYHNAWYCAPARCLRNLR